MQLPNSAAAYIELPLAFNSEFFPSTSEADYLVNFTTALCLSLCTLFASASKVLLTQSRSYCKQHSVRESVLACEILQKQSLSKRVCKPLECSAATSSSSTAITILLYKQDLFLVEINILEINSKNAEATTYCYHL